MGTENFEQSLYGWDRLMNITVDKHAVHKTIESSELCVVHGEDKVVRSLLRVSVRVI